MRLWSLHPKYLDRPGLGGLWKEALEAQDILGQDVGLAPMCNRKTPIIMHVNHPALMRFRAAERPLEAIATFLRVVWQEAGERGYAYNGGLIRGSGVEFTSIPVTVGQVMYECAHLNRKLADRNPAMIMDSYAVAPMEINPVFQLQLGDIEPWEKR